MFNTSQSTWQAFAYPSELVYRHLLKAIPAAGLSLKSADEALLRVTASAGMSLFSWGENMTFIIEPQADANTRVYIDSSLKFGPSGGGRHQKNFNAVIAALGKSLRESAQREAT
ncbi:hypothetical protein G3545_14100 [Starkeya sp. ORNL1]|uniref:hypothetical protein n=1 Tax=Starkeya sp. ORNL1 TaxID=2709380 RepID=UPI0014633B0E|nr:hypothetical protein [Starkeya sp. ORNL1]QJP14676.1 hypothetical protein G3545_14100 [Starkeya sp. ORNL1]